MYDFPEIPMTLKEEALALVLKIYGALCTWEYSYDKRSDYTLIHYVDELVTDFVEERCKDYFVAGRKEPSDTH